MTEQTSLDETLAATRQKICNLGAGEGLPDPEELTESEKDQYDKLKSHYIDLKNIQKAKEKAG